MSNTYLVFEAYMSLNSSTAATTFISVFTINHEYIPHI